MTHFLPYLFISTLFWNKFNTEPTKIIDSFTCYGNATILAKDYDVITLSCVALSKRLFKQEHFWAFEKIESKNTVKLFYENSVVPKVKQYL